MEDEIARAAAARLVAAACRGHGRFWSHQEQLRQLASEPEDAVAAAAPLLEFCAQCPIRAECAVWAEADEYTGIAAGTAWKDGQQQPVDDTAGHSQRRLWLPLAG